MKSYFISSVCTDCRDDHNVSKTCGVGKPHSEHLNTSEREAFSQRGVVIPANARVLVYQKLAIAATRRTVAASSSRQTLRDNSCFVYCRNEYALLQKVISFSGEEFALAVPLSRATKQLCNDDVTNSELNAHLSTLDPPV